MKYTHSTAMTNVQISVNERQITSDIYYVDVDMTFDEPTHPSGVTIQWHVPIVDCYSVLGPEDYYRRNLQPSWNRRVNTSCFCYGGTYQQTISADGQNRMTIAVSDAAIPTQITSGVHEASVSYRCSVTFFTEPTEKITEYHATIYIDMTDRPYSESLFALQDFFREAGYASPYYPQAARSALYSTWYAFHTGLTADTVLAECREGVHYGLDMLIVDDGWQTVYSDWTVNTAKFPDMAKFVADIHALGMKCMLWIGLPFLSPEARCYDRFRDMVLNPQLQERPVFDPRYPEVRQYLCGRLAEMAKDWKYDGFKIDFIDFFRPYPTTPAPDPRQDTESIFRGTEYLLRELTETLRAINPDFMLEFRQPYYSPAVCTYASMMRVGDCAADAMENHVRGVALRYSVGDLPVHSDMLTWNVADPVESAARQVLSTLFLVPQISVRFGQITEEHREMLAFYLKFRNENVSTLLDGTFEAENPELLYPMVTARKDGHRISVSHGKNILKTDAFKKLHYINASGETEHFLRLNEDLGEVDCTIFTCTGKIAAQQTRILNTGIHAFQIPLSGMLVITPRT